MDRDHHRSEAGMMEQHTSVAHPVLKIITAWAAALGIGSWSDLAAALAALYSLILICEWLWKKLRNRK